MNKNKEIERMSWDLMAKFLAGEADQEEKLLFESWIGLSDVNRKEFEKNKQLFENIDLRYNLNKYNANFAFEKVQNEINKNSKKQKSGKKIFMSVLKYAAIIFFAITLGITGYFLGFKELVQSPGLEIAAAEKEIINDFSLPDGTKITLNSNSTLEYPRQFSGKSREVKITGEAFFDVTPNPDKPFIINAGDAQIKVLGTSFNVNAYPGSETIEVVVETGTVQVFSEKSENHVILEKGDKATLNKRENILERNYNNDPNYISWKTHLIYYNNSKLEYVFNVIEKTYHVEIEVSDPEIYNLAFTSTFNEKSVDFILDVIRLTFNLELSEDNGRYIFKSHNS